MKVSKQPGVIILPVMIMILFYVISFTGAAYLGSQILDNYRANVLVRECDALDNALLMYAKAHRRVNPDSIRIKKEGSDNSGVYYATGPIFPETLDDLGIVRREQGCFSMAINLSKFTYTTQVDADGNMTYTLGVTMPNGTYYISPLSKK